MIPKSVTDPVDSLQDYKRGGRLVRTSPGPQTRNDLDGPEAGLVPLSVLFSLLNGEILLMFNFQIYHSRPLRLLAWWYNDTLL